VFKIVSSFLIMFEHVSILLATATIVVTIGGQNLGSSAKIATM